MMGYNNLFLDDQLEVNLPDYTYYKNRLAINNDTGNELLNYLNYCVIHCKERKLPILSASNIYRINFNPIPRAGNFKKDKRISNECQLSSKDYRQFNTLKPSTIEKGHMTKREDVQWSFNEDRIAASKAAISTFYYTNACPQHDKINNGPWKHLENSIIIKGHIQEPAKVIVFTGPVLNEYDPEIKSQLADGKKFQIPTTFWKVIYYIKNDRKLYYAGFLMGQSELLKKDDLIDEINYRDFNVIKTNLKPFLEFKDDKNYQVPIKFIEDLTNLKFTKAIDRHSEIQFSELYLHEVKFRDLNKKRRDTKFHEYIVDNLIV